MASPYPVEIELEEAARQGLAELIRRYSTPQQMVVRARIVLLAAERKNHHQIAQELGVSVDMARLWRKRWDSLAAIPLSELSVRDRLEDAPRPGKPATISPKQVCQIVALACEAPEASGRPVSQWTGKEIADELMRRGIVATISPRHAQRLLKRGILCPTASATG